MLEVDADKRITAEGTLAHPYLAEVKRSQTKSTERPNKKCREAYLAHPYLAEVQHSFISFICSREEADNSDI